MCSSTSLLLIGDELIQLSSFTPTPPPPSPHPTHTHERDRDRQADRQADRQTESQRYRDAE